MAQDNKAPVQGIHADAYLSALDINEPDNLRVLMERRGDQWAGSATKIVQSLGFERPASNETVNHWEDDSYMRPVKIGATVSAGQGGSGAAFDITLAAGEVFTDGNSGKHIFPRVGDVLMFPNVTGAAKDRLAIVTAINAATPKITVKFLQAAWTTSAMSSGAYLVLTTAAFSAGTGQPTSTIRNTRKKSAKLQIIKETWTGEGSEMTNGKWFKTTSGGKDISLFYAYGMEQVDYLHLMKTDGALLFGQETDNTITDPTGYSSNPISTTEGAFPKVRTEGNTLEYPRGAFSIADFNEASQYCVNEKTGNAMMVWHGHKLGIELEDLLINYTSDTNINYVVGETNGKKMLEFGFHSIKKAGITWVFRELDLLNNPEQFGVTGFEDKQHQAIVFPIAMERMYANVERSSSRMAPLFGMRYKALGPYNRRMQVWEVGGTGHTPAARMITEYDTTNLYSRSHIGFQGMCFNKWQIWEGVAA